MARFTGSLGQIAGKVGGVVFTRNRYGGVLRVRGVPVNVRSASQRFMRGITSGASSLWRQTIAPAGSDIAWNAFAANFPLHQGKGNKTAVTVTGQAFSVAINALRAMLGLAMVTTPPDTWGTDQPTDVVATGVGSTSLAITSIGGVTPDATHIMMVKATGPIPKGVRFIGKSKYRFVSGYAGPITFPQDISADYKAVFGQVPPQVAS